MPFYDYKCVRCGNQAEIYMPINASWHPVCDKCAGDMVRLVSTTQPPVFKGKGFHSTDYKDKK